jgi:hypothetical protein
VTNSATNNAVDRTSKRHPITATVVYPDASLRRVTLRGDDSAKFAAIRRLVGSSVTALEIDDQDGPAAMGWVADVSGGDDRLTRNAIASAISNRPVGGPMVVTGRGHGNAALTSIHAGLQVVLEQMVAHGAPFIAS